MLIIWKWFCLAGPVWLWHHYLHARGVYMCVCVCITVRQIQQCTGRCWLTPWFCVRSTPSSWGTLELGSTDRETSTSSPSASPSSPLSGTAPIGLCEHTHTLFSPGFYSSSSTVNHLHVRETAARPVTAELPHKEMKYTSSRSETLCYCGSRLQLWQEF